MPSLTDLEQFLVTGLSLGGVYALSGVGMIVLYRATGVLNLAFGAVGAMGALIAWQLINHSGMGFWPAALVCVLFAGVLTLVYGMVFGPALAGARPAGQSHGDAGPDTDPARGDGPVVALERRRIARDHAPDRQQHLPDRHRSRSPTRT